MAGSFSNGKDSVDISELASLNEDISDDMIEKLQQQLTQNLSDSSEKQIPDANDDSTLFEEIDVPQANAQAEVQKSVTEEPIQEAAQEPQPQDTQEVKAEEKAEAKPENKPEEPKKKEEVTVNQDFDDNFIKKYKAKLKNKQNLKMPGEPVLYDAPASADTEEKEQIEVLSQGNITEKPMTPELKEYNDSLDFLDGNVKYSKYVMYIDPENVDFIDGLTVKERKNLINRILRQQDDIAITKKKFKMVQSVINHIIIAILTLTISIPIIYYAINASLEATINNHRNAQTNWQTLYKEHGKITQN